MSGLGICTLCFTVEEGALLLEALGARPFKEVFALIGRINHEANQQLRSGGNETRFCCDRNELELMLRALAELPFNRVHGLMAKLHVQLQAQREQQQAEQRL